MRQNVNNDTFGPRADAVAATGCQDLVIRRRSLSSANTEGPVRQLIFDIAIHCVGRVLLARDLALGSVKRNWGVKPAEQGVTRLAIQSGRNVLDAVLVMPASKETRASVLICHGIGETVQNWFAIQGLLATCGVASLVFDYSGYGRSSGVFHARQSEQDAVSAFFCLQRLTKPLPISLLGFSLGSGIAIAILGRVHANAMLLCAAFTSLREAVRSVGVLKIFCFAVPPIWCAKDVLRTCNVPVRIVHGEKDRVFPVKMAAELNDFCGSRAEVDIVANLAHNEPYSRPQMSYWGPIASHLLAFANAKDVECQQP